MSTLITGGAGFLGRHLASALAMRGERVLVLDDLSETNSNFRRDELTHPSIECVLGSTLDASLLRDLLLSVHVVVHFASVVGVERTISEPIETTRNIVGRLNIVAGLNENHVAIFGSSADVYGMRSLTHNVAMREDDPVLFEHSLVNRWIYPKVKSLEESLLCNTAARTVVIRFFNTYGPFMDWPKPKRVIPEFLHALLCGQPMRVSGDGTQIRCFCHYSDTVRGIVAAIDCAEGRNPWWHTVVNIGNDEEISVLDLATLLNDIGVEFGLSTAPVPIIKGAVDLYSQPFNDSWNRRPDLALAAKILGFAPRIGLEDGLRQTLKAMLEEIDNLPQETPRPLRITEKVRARTVKSTAGEMDLT
jgi:UDP-glucose 4-epimerase